MNRETFRTSFAAAAIAAALGLASPAAASRVYVHVAPPAVRIEVRGVAPSPHHVWHEGYWSWNGGTHVWVAGRWALPPHPGAVWVAGHWKHAHEGWYWIDGHWRH